MYKIGYNHVSCFQIDPIIEDSLTTNTTKSISVYANPNYKHYQWTVSTADTNEVNVEQTGWVFLTATNDYGISVRDSVYVDVTSAPQGIYENLENLNVYPNPACERIVISDLTKDADIIIKIYAIDGKTMLKKSFYNTGNKVYLNIESLHSGYYTIQISDRNGKWDCRKSLIKY